LIAGQIVSQSNKKAFRPASDNFLATPHFAMLYKSSEEALKSSPNKTTKRICQAHDRRLRAARLP